MPRWVRMPVGAAKKCVLRSFRTRKVAKGKVLLTFCCPRGKWAPRSERCKAGMKLAEKAVRR